MRATGSEGDNTANTFGILLDGVFKTGTSRTAASGWITLTFDFLASAGSHTVAFAGERGGVDAAYEIDNVSVVALRVPKYVTDWANGNALLYIDTAGRRVTTNTGKPSLLPINQVALGNFTRVYDKIVPGGGTDVLNIHSSGSGVGDLAVLMDTYRVPVDELAGGVPVLRATGAALPSYHLSPVRKTYFGGEPVLDPFTGQQLTYAGGEPVVDLFTGQPVLDPFDNPVLHQAGDLMLHVAGEPVYHLRGEQQRWLGGEVVVDELGNPVYNNATTPFLHASGQAIVQNRRQVVYDLVDKNGDKKPADSALYEPRTLTASTGTPVALGYNLAAGDKVFVTVYQGTRIENLLSGEFTFTTGLTNDTLTITKSLTGPVTIKVVIAVPAVHAAGDPKYYFGDDLVAEGDPITDSQGNLTFDNEGNVRVYGAADLTVQRRELLNFGTGIIKLQTDAARGPEGLPRRHAAELGLLLHRQHADDHPGVTPAAGTRVIVEYSGARLHRRGEPVYKQDATGFWIADTYAANAPKLTLGNEAALYYGGERSDYYADDRRLVVQDEQRLLVKGTKGMPGSIHWFDVDDVNLFLGAGNDKVTIDTTHAGTTDVDTAGGADQVAIRSISGDTSVLTQAGTDAISVGSNAGFWSEYTAQGVITVTRFISVNGTLDDIDALLTVNGGADVDALRLDDTGDSATDDNTGTLTLNTIRGLDMTEGVDYTAFESLNVDLGAGDDTFTIESTHASGDFERYTTVEGRGGDDRLYVKTTDSVTTVRGDGSETIGTHLVSTGEGTDFIKVGTLAPDSLGTLNEIVGLLTIDGGGGGTDLLWVDDTGDGQKNIGSLSSTTLAGLGMTLTPFGTRPDLIQVVTVRNAVDGRFQLKIGSQLTTELDWDATQDEVRAALEALLGRPAT